MKSNHADAVFPARLLALTFALSTIALAVFFAPTPSVRAAPKGITWTVSSIGDGDATPSNCPHVSNCRLRDAIQAAGIGDTIDFSLTLPAVISLISGTLTMNDLNISGPGQNNLTIRGNSASGVIGVGGHTTISGLTIRDGNAGVNDGGGISNNNSTLTLTNVSVISNTANLGGGIWIGDGGKAILISTTVADNVAISGGGIYNNGSSAVLSLMNSTVTRNLAISGLGGGIFSGGTITATNSTLSSNQSTESGGAIYNVGRLTANAVTVSGNKVVGSGAGGGGIYAESSLTMTLNNVTISGNSSDPSGDGWGGGILSKDTPSNLNNVTITNNKTGSNGGGGIRTTGSAAFTFQNTLFFGNTAASGADCDGGNPLISQDYNLVDASTCGFIGTTTHNVSGNPKLTPLASLGGPTQVHGLLSGSPAINAGNNAACLLTDQRGTVRPLTIGNPCDIGAFEGIASALYLPLILR